MISMEVAQVRDRGDGVKKATIPKDSDIEDGDYIKMFKIPEDEAEELEEN